MIECIIDCFACHVQQIHREEQHAIHEEDASYSEMERHSTLGGREHAPQAYIYVCNY